MASVIDRFTKKGRQYSTAILIAGALILISLVGALTALSPPITVFLAIAVAGGLMALVAKEQVLLIALAIVPLANIVIVQVGVAGITVDLRITQVLWITILGSTLMYSALIRRELSLALLPGEGLLLLFIATQAVSAVFSVAPAVSLKETVQYLYLFLVFHTVQVYVNDGKEHLYRVVASILLSAALFTIGALITWMLGRAVLPQVRITVGSSGMGWNYGYGAIASTAVLSGESMLRVDAFYSGIVSGAIFLSQILLIPVGLLVGGRIGGNLRVVTFVLLALGLGVLILTYSRGPWVFFALGVLVLLVLSRRELGRSFLPLVMLLTILGLVAILGPGLSRFQELASPMDVYNVVARLALWNRAVELFWAHPLTGTGVDTFHLMAGENLSYLGTQTWIGGEADVHNQYLKTAAETGALGVVALVAVVIFYLHRLYRSSQLPEATVLGDLVRGLFVVVLVGFLNLLTANYFSRESLWILLATAIGAANLLAAESQRGSEYPAICTPNPGMSH